ncbi:hypothetical protein ACFVHQ_12565 [Actinomycetes bacterium NPDC127524]
MFSPSYGNFWHTGYVVINPGDPLPLNNTSTAVTGGISRSGNVINIPQAGDYLISYSVTIFQFLMLKQEANLQIIIITWAAIA